MTRLSFEIPDSIAEALRASAARHGVTLQQVLASAASEKLSALETLEPLRARARRACPEGLAAWLDASPDAPPMPGDERV